MAYFSIGMALHSEGSCEDKFAQLTDGLAWSSAGRRRGRRQGNPMSQIDSFGMSGSSWLKVAAGMSSGTAAMSDTANVNCANGGWCSQLSTGRAPMAGTVVAVSGTKNDLSVSPASARGSCSPSVVQGALGGSTSGGGLTYAGKYKYQRHILGPLFETVVGITFIWDGRADLLEGISATGAVPGTEGAPLVPAIGLSALGALDTVAESALSLDAVTRFTGQKPLLPVFNPLFN